MEFQTRNTHPRSTSDATLQWSLTDVKVTTDLSFGAQFVFKLKRYKQFDLKHIFQLLAVLFAH